MKEFIKWLAEQEAQAHIMGAKERPEGYWTGFLHALQEVKDELMERGMYHVD